MLAVCAAAWQHKLSSMDIPCFGHSKPSLLCRSKAKNAQEAHEAVRPTDAARQPDGLQVTEARLRRLYDLIWRRTLASQMAAARIRQVLRSRMQGFDFRAQAQPPAQPVNSWISCQPQ
jgi:DNA topoisomerase IA